MHRAFLIALFFASVLQAQDGEGALRRAVQACASLQNDSERLACYDRLGKKDEITASAPEEMFGLSAQTSRPQSASKALQSISARVVAVREAESGGLIIALDNGQSWRATSAQLLLRVGDRVTISRGALGSFRLGTPGNRFSRVERIR